MPYTTRKHSWHNSVLLGPLGNNLCANNAAVVGGGKRKFFNKFKSDPIKRIRKFGKSVGRLARDIITPGLPTSTAGLIGKVAFNAFVPKPLRMGLRIANALL